MNEKEKIQELYDELPLKNYFITFKCYNKNTSDLGSCHLECKPLVISKNNVEKQIAEIFKVEKAIILYYQEVSEEEVKILEKFKNI